MKVLLTGFTGFIGQALYKKLLCDEIDLHVTSRFPQHSIKNAYVIDLLDHEATHSLVQKIKPDILIHLAWDVTHGEFWTSSKNVLYADASIHLFQCFIENGGKKIIATGTCAEYPVSNKSVSETISVDTSILTPYGREKRRVSEWLKNNNCDFTWLRIFGIYGNGENSKRLFPSIIRSVQANEEFMIRNPSIFYDYVCVNDLVNFIVFYLYNKGLNIINIGTGESYAVYDLYCALVQYLKSGLFSIKKTIKNPNLNSRIPNVQKLRESGYQFDLNASFFKYGYYVG